MTLGDPEHIATPHAVSVSDVESRHRALCHVSAGCHQSVTKLAYPRTRSPTKDTLSLKSQAHVGKRPMKLHASPIVTTIVTVIVTAASSIVTPVSAQVLTVCANSEQTSAASERFRSRRLADAIIPLSGRTDDDDSLIALWQDDKGFDILVNFGKSDQHSLRADGAQILGMAPDNELVHLMIAHSDGGLEHFLFDLDANGTGELLRSSSDNDVPDMTAVCVKPR
jgi:hypothetical protein